MKRRFRSAALFVAACIILFSPPSPRAWAANVHTDFREGLYDGDFQNTTIQDGTVQMEAGTRPGPVWNRTLQGWPCGRTEAAFVYDAAGDRAILFGGRAFQRGYLVGSVGSHYLNDTWCFYPANGTWRQLGFAPFDGAPSMVFDSSTQTAFAYPDSGGCGWKYYASNNTWEKVDMTDGPEARFQVSMSYDTDRRQAIIFGGVSQGWLKGDTWAFDLSSGKWSSLNQPGAPSPRANSAFVYDRQNRRMLLFGGVNYTLLNDTWSLDPVTGQWTNMRPARSPPPAEGKLDAEFDHSRGSMVAYLWNATWAYNLSANAWTMLLPGAAPGQRQGCSLAYDTLRYEALLFGASGYPEKNDLWRFDSGKGDWERFAEAAGPGERVYHCMAYDSVNEKVVLFGGYDGISEKNDIWVYNVSSGKWTEMATALRPPARSSAAFAFDSKRGDFILAGGYAYNTTLDDFERYTDTWSYNLSTNTWKDLGSTSPTWLARKMVYHEAQDVMVAPYGQTKVWLYYPESNGWYTKEYAGPWVEGFPSIIYDPDDELVVQFGGEVYNEPCREVWTYDLGGNEWTRGSNEIPSDPQWDGDIVYNSNLNVLDVVDIYGSTWTYSVPNMLWAKVADAACETACRSEFRMAYDEANDAIVMYGGGLTGPSKYVPYATDTMVATVPEKARYGHFTSGPFDAGGRAYFGRLEWNSTVPRGSNLSFQVRTASTSSSLVSSAFLGPDGTAGTYYNVSGQNISGIHNGSRWFQYRARLETRLQDSPILSSVSFSYNLAPALMLLSPTGGENWTGRHDIIWSAEDPDYDTLSFDILLLSPDVSAHPEILVQNLSSSTRAWSWDLSAVANGTYRLILACRDADADIPIALNATSEEFTVYHPPPPNNPPRIELVSPAQGAVIPDSEVVFSWRAEDADGDPLNYTLRYGPTSSGIWTTERLTDEFLLVRDLKDQTIYRWTVSVTDGWAEPVEAPIWNFTVRLPPPPPHPPIFTSAPQPTAEVSHEWTYKPELSDEVNGTFTFRLLSMPAGMRIDLATGELNWTPWVDQLGDNAVALRVFDESGYSTDQNFSVRVSRRLPECSILSPHNGTSVRGRFVVSGSASNGSLPLRSVQLRIDGKEWVNASGTGSWSLELDASSLGAGRNTVYVRSSDGYFFSNVTEVTVNVPERSSPVDSARLVTGALMVLLVLAAVAGYLWKRRGRPPKAI